MKWKDWLFIPKSDKTAIIILLAAILILLTTYFALTKYHSSEETFEPSALKSEEYEIWKSGLIINKEKDNEDYTDKRPIPFQHKLKKGETIELNSADTSALKTIPGSGSGYANRITKYRNSLGGFANIEQLSEVWGMDTYLFSQIHPYFTLSAPHDSVYINTDSFEKLLKHPYLNYKQVEVITDIRDRKGAVKSLKRLALLDEFNKRDIERLSLYASFTQ